MLLSYPAFFIEKEGFSRKGPIFISAEYTEGGILELFCALLALPEEPDRGAVIMIKNIILK